MKIKKLQIFWIICTIVATLIISTFLILFSPTPEKTTPKNPSILVDTLVAEPSNQKIIIEAFGEVQPSHEVTLRPEVSGKVIEQSPQLELGGIVKKGEVLLRIDPRDLLNLVEQQKAAFEKATFDLELEKGRQIIAKREWEQLNPTILATEISEDLALRKPHLKEKQAQLAAAKSKLEKAKIDLSRTVIKAPMDSIVISENIDIGDFISPQTEVAKLVATSTFRVQLSIPIAKLKWLKIPSANGVKVIQDLGDKELIWEGHLIRLLGNLDPTGRMARLLVEVNNPLDNDFPLLIGTYVKVELEGPELNDVIVLPREALREGNVVWIKNEMNELEIRKLNPIQKNDQVVFIQEGLRPGEEIILTQLSIPYPGMKLRSEK